MTDSQKAITNVRDAAFVISSTVSGILTTFADESQNPLLKARVKAVEDALKQLHQDAATLALSADT